MCEFGCVCVCKYMSDFFRCFDSRIHTKTLKSISFQDRSDSADKFEEKDGSEIDGEHGERGEQTNGGGYGE